MPRFTRSLIALVIVSALMLIFVVENALEIAKLKKEKVELESLIPDLMTRIQDTYEEMRFGTEEAKRILDDWLVCCFAGSKRAFVPFTSAQRQPQTIGVFKK